MANIKSAKKRIKVTARRKEENRGKKTELATAIKKFRALVAKRELEAASAFLPKVVSLIDSAAGNSRLHKNNASRKKARLASMLDKAKTAPSTEVLAKAKPAPAKKVEKEVAPEVVAEVKEEKPAPAKKAAAPAKKPAAKTTAAKATEKPAAKPAAKKTTTKKA